MPKPFRLFRKKRALIPLLLLSVIVAMGARPAWVLTRAVYRDRDERKRLPSGMVDDASRLNLTIVRQVCELPADESAEGLLRDLLVLARDQHLRIAIAGARHSMGGQTIYPRGLQLNMLPHNAMTFDAQQQLLHVQAGARWADVIKYLDPLGKSVAIMQANNDFSVGGSLSVNCHGWQFDRPPIDSTVVSFRIMLADGSVQTCSRTENPELFSLALGGYGLFGVILDADLQVTSNVRYELKQLQQPTSQFLDAWRQQSERSPDIGMAFGRLSVAPDNFLNDSLLYVIRPAPLPTGEIPSLQALNGNSLARAIFLASADSDYGKTLRWKAETHLFTHIVGRFFSRNQLQNVPADTLMNHTDATTDILQEYFVPRDRLADFLVALREIIPRSGADLLNVTLRDVREDHDSMLRYADADMIALVLLYHQQRLSQNAKMEQLTRDSIDAAIACGGRYYLPYRLDASPEQFRRAYPMANRFFELKRKYDPDELFQNSFYMKYGLSN